jgi:uncharacterized protein YqfA (UPF0365 family)
MAIAAEQEMKARCMEMTAKGAWLKRKYPWHGRGIKKGQLGVMDITDGKMSGCTQMRESLSQLLKVRKRIRSNH